MFIENIEKYLRRKFSPRISLARLFDLRPERKYEYTRERENYLHMYQATQLLDRQPIAIRLWRNAIVKWSSNIPRSIGENIACDKIKIRRIVVSGWHDRVRGVHKSALGDVAWQPGRKASLWVPRSLSLSKNLPTRIWKSFLSPRYSVYPST